MSNIRCTCMCISNITSVNYIHNNKRHISVSLIIIDYIYNTYKYITTFCFWTSIWIMSRYDSRTTTFFLECLHQVEYAMSIDQLVSVLVYFGAEKAVSKLLVLPKVVRKCTRSMSILLLVAGLDLMQTFDPTCEVSANNMDSYQ